MAAAVDRHMLKAWVVEALRQLNGSGSIVQVCQRVWQMHEVELRASGDLFYTWHMTFAGQLNTSATQDGWWPSMVTGGAGGNFLRLYGQRRLTKSPQKAHDDRRNEYAVRYGTRPFHLGSDSVNFSIHVATAKQPGKKVRIALPCSR